MTKIDILENIQLEYNVHEYGKIELLDSMPRLLDENELPDSAIAYAARTSYGKGTKTISNDEGLIRYLMRHRHTTPFEMVEFKFFIKCPIFIARQWMRHRTASINEYSGRYSEMVDEFYYPQETYMNTQSDSNKQMSSEEIVVDFATCKSMIIESSEESFENYTTLLANGLSREKSRIVLPLNIYTQFYWKINLHNLLHFLSLRMDSHAQQEIIDYANIIYSIVNQLFPIASRAFEDYRLNAVTFSAEEMRILLSMFEDVPSEVFEYLEDNIEYDIQNKKIQMSKRELKEFFKKINYKHPGE